MSHIYRIITPASGVESPNPLAGTSPARLIARCAVLQRHNALCRSAIRFGISPDSSPPISNVSE